MFVLLGLGTTLTFVTFLLDGSFLHSVILPVVSIGLLVRMVPKNQIKFYLISKGTFIDFP